MTNEKQSSMTHSVKVTAPNATHERPQWDFDGNGPHLSFIPTAPFPCEITFTLTADPTSSYSFSPTYPPTIFEGATQLITTNPGTTTTTLVLTASGALSAPIPIILFVVDGKQVIHASPDPTADPQN